MQTFEKELREKEEITFIERPAKIMTGQEKRNERRKKKRKQRNLF